MKARQLYIHYAYLFPLVMAFLLPFNFGVAIVAAFWLAGFIFLGDTRTMALQAFRQKWFYVLSSFFLLHVLAYTYTSNKAEAAFSIEIKLSFLIFPFLLFAHRFNAMQASRIVAGFVLGCLCACLFNVGRATWYYVTQHVNYFYYSDFTHATHPSYFAMFLVLAALLGVLWCPRWLAGKRYGLLVTVLLFALFSMCVVISASKLGILSFALLVPVTLFYMQLMKRKYKQLLLLVAGVVLLFALGYYFFPQPFWRIREALKANAQEHIDKTSRESTVVRKLVWHEAAGIIREHPLTGVGPGDANDELYKAYERSGMTGALFKRLNAHNQFLQTFLGLGIAGFLLLCAMTLYTAVLGIVKKNGNLLLFSALIILNFLVESMLQTQAGTLFYVFFLCLFLQYNFNQVAPNIFQKQIHTT